MNKAKYCLRNFAFTQWRNYYVRMIRYLKSKNLLFREFFFTPQAPLQRHLSATSSVFHPNMQHPQFYTLSISSMILHFYHFLTCLIIPWISSCTISNSISQNVISSQPFHPHLKCLPFHPCIFHPRMTRIGWKRRVEYANMKLLG